MILDKLENAETYTKLHPGFAKAFEFLRRGDLSSLGVASYPIDEKKVFALVQKGSGKRRGEARLEAHRNFIDIQFLIDGNEQVGWKPRADCTEVSQAYNHEKDIEFFADQPQTYLSLKPGMFCVFFPDDAHAPMISEGLVHKCVVKVKLS